ncbi:MAG: class I SAM-dependent methyltransferase [Spirochaetales bacterium]|nr:class I SAM-dependent methyltransferase [Spirochaetales bacterium]
MKTYSVNPKKERQVKVACNICGSESFKLLFKVDSAQFVKCTNCGLVYQNPQPVFEDLKLRYSENYFRYEIENESNFYKLMKLGLEDIEFKKITKNITDREKTFLDIGCATGMLLENMRNNGWKTVGVEICDESAEYGRKNRNLDIRTGTLESVQFESGSFYTVHFSHLIEHLTNPRKFLREVYRILNPEGFAIITTPNIDGLQAQLLKSRWRSAIADHLYLFSKKTLYRLLSSTGFNIFKTVTWGGIAKGLAPNFIKQPIDRLAKRFGFGDVVLFLVNKKS